MSIDKPITRENLDVYLKTLSKEFRRLNGIKMQAEIVLIGGAAILANYGFRELTYDVDAVIVASSAMKEAINITGDKMGLRNRWLNTDFKYTGSYSDKLLEVSVYYKTFSNIVQVRTVAAEYLIAMKLMSGRRYKNDISDIYGVLWEHQKKGTPILKAAIKQAVTALYGNISKLSEKSALLLEKAFEDGNFEALYIQSRKDETDAKELLLEFEEQYPHTLKTENIDTVLEQMKQKRDAAPKKESLLARLDTAKDESREINANPTLIQKKRRNGQER
jgi:hypothetical protein